MFKTLRHTAPALPVLAAVLVYGVAESIALSRSRAGDWLRAWRRKLSGP